MRRARKASRATSLSSSEPRYRATLINTVLLAAATTVATLITATIAGMFLQRHRFPGRAVLIAMLTFPLAFPGVVIGFLIILLAGRQGLIGDLSNRLFGEKLVFAYSIYGLFLGYLYFSISRVILTIMAAVQKLDVGLEEAARSLGASPWAVQRPVARQLSAKNENICNALFNFIGHLFLNTACLGN